jgi:hypothetical protein
MRLDAVFRELQRVESLLVGTLEGRVDLGSGNPDRLRCERHAIEFLRILDQRVVAARLHAAQDITSAGIDIFRCLTLASKEGLKSRREIGSAGIECNRHLALPSVVLRAFLGRPFRTEIAHRHLDAFDIELHGRVTGEI